MKREMLRVERENALLGIMKTKEELVAEKNRDMKKYNTGHHQQHKEASARLLSYWNQNTLDEVLLLAAAFVTLCGVIFMSKRFDHDQNLHERDVLAYVCVLVLVVSTLFFFVVLF